nr:DUF362 domain-containing protein [Methanohalophilus euhalobius]
MSDSVLDADYIINLLKLKTHELTTMTGAVKKCSVLFPCASGRKDT